MCPKVVQKYIERPLLVKKRKFDLRQWVFVNSFDPLEIMVYKQAYLRICAKDFDITQFQDLQRHISNFSVNREDELVMSTGDFIKYLNENGHASITWENHFLPQIQTICRNVFAQSGEVIESKPQFFELYGFDFAVDKDLNLWLIEVNMSPACQERQPWLSEMLDDMSSGLTAMIAAKVNSTPIAKAAQGTLWEPLDLKDKIYFNLDGRRTRVKIAN